MDKRLPRRLTRGRQTNKNQSEDVESMGPNQALPAMENGVTADNKDSEMTNKKIKPNDMVSKEPIPNVLDL